MIRYVCFLVIFLSPLLATADRPHNDLRPLYEAIRHVETGGHPDPENAKGDGGRSLGPYQIQEPYFIDSRVGGEYEQVVRDQSKAELVMYRYWERYAPEAIERLDFEVLARIHNGGPRAMSDRRRHLTDAYWKKVSNKLHEEQP